MFDVRTPLLILHIAVGTVAVAVGMVALLARKPVGAPGKVHRSSGRVFLICLSVALVSAILLTVIRPKAYFVGLTASSLVCLFSGWRVLGRKRPDLRAADRAKLADWAVAGATFATGATLVAMASMGMLGRNVVMFYAMGSGTMMYAGYDLYRFMRPLGFPFSPDLWLYEHLVKMIGAYFGAVASFSGNVLMLLPEPWRQLWAISLGQFLAVALTIRYVRLMRRRRGERLARVEERPSVARPRSEPAEVLQPA
ncbi:MAG TPA: hypothetical protein VGC13_22805 [Longimicrobium sp.]|jgi:uncharacterized membrane protein|uniref:hypothetical protein n=1 Tax=Longimicrobium sp. TaxID=2029185 RepID=UPI002ED81AB5